MQSHRLLFVALAFLSVFALVIFSRVRSQRLNPALPPPDVPPLNIEDKEALLSSLCSTREILLKLCSSRPAFDYCHPDPHIDPLCRAWKAKQ